MVVVVGVVVAAGMVMVMVVVMVVVMSDVPYHTGMFIEEVPLSVLSVLCVRLIIHFFPHRCFLSTAADDLNLV